MEDGWKIEDIKVQTIKIDLMDIKNNIKNNSQIYEEIKTENKIVKNEKDDKGSQQNNCFDNTFCCNICGTVLADKRKLYDHKALYHSKPQECKTCGMNFKNIRYLRTHIKFKHNNTNHYVCYICEKEFSGSSGNFKRHVEMCNRTNFAVKCEFCHVNIMKTKIGEHILHSHPDIKQTKYRKCKLCETVFKSKGSLIRHEKNVHPDLVQQEEKQEREPISGNKTCSICSKVFTKKFSRKKHERNCDGKPKSNEVIASLICQKCGKIFGTRKASRQHINTTRCGNGVFRKCNECGKTYNRGKQEAHMKRHLHGEKIKWKEMVHEFNRDTLECGIEVKRLCWEKLRILNPGLNRDKVLVEPLFYTDVEDLMKELVTKESDMEKDQMEMVLQSLRVKMGDSIVPQDVMENSNQPKTMVKVEAKEGPWHDYSTYISSYNSQELDVKVDSMLTNVDGKWKCSVCGKNSKCKNKQNIKKHIRIHIEANHINGITHPCNECDKVSTTRHGMAKHMYEYHNKTKDNKEKEQKSNNIIMNLPIKANKFTTSSETLNVLFGEKKTMQDALPFVIDAHPITHGQTDPLLTGNQSQICAAKNSDEEDTDIATYALPIRNTDELEHHIKALMKMKGKYHDVEAKDWVKRNKIPMEFVCKLCGKASIKRNHIKEHIESNHIVGISYPCKQCGKVSKSKKALSDHINVVHNYLWTVKKNYIFPKGMKIHIIVPKAMC